jgi:sulfide:quinone oxidoreductase
MTSEDHPFRVLIAGGGVAGLEAALALRELAGDRVAATMLAPEEEFVYRPMRVREPFGYAEARRYSLDDITADIGVDLVRDSFKWLDPDAHVVHTGEGEQLPYDGLLLALGAVLRPRFRHALTLDDRELDEQLHGLIQDIEGGYVHKLAFVAPHPMPWPLPMYELALMTARRASDMNIELSVTLVTPEDAPLAIFGSTVSDAVDKLLSDHDILTVHATYGETPEAGQLVLQPGGRVLHVDRVVALPQLYGPATPGLSKDAADSFIPVDPYCRVPGVDGIWAAGDATDFPIKLGGIAAQQADTAAQSIAAAAGVPIQPSKFHPVIHAMLLGGDRPVYLSAHVTGGHGSSSEVSNTPMWSPGTKIDAEHLAPCLEARDRAALR